METRRKFTVVGIAVGTLLTLSPVIGMLGTVLGMLGAFKQLGNAGVSDPRVLAESIGTTLMSTAIGLFLFPVGVLILVLSLVFYFRLREVSPPPVPGGLRVKN